MPDPIILVSYDPRWPIYFEEEADWLRNVLPYGLPLAIEHFGATATPGMEARPIIDILVAVQSVDEARKSLGLLKGLGYRLDEGDRHGDRLLLVKEGERGYCATIARIDSPWYEQLQVRDLLRTDREEAARYTALKRAHAADADAYERAKADFAHQVLAKARARAERLARQWDADDD